MFFPKDILVRKGKFGIIWIAATHSSGRKCDFLTKRDYFTVNIPKACYDILHPRIPFALRLSSHLMFGISRIYQKQTKITLDETQQMWIRVNEAFDKRHSLELFTVCARLDSITFGDPIKSATMGYLLEPFREDIVPYPEPLFHVGDASFFDVNGSINIFASPSKSSIKSSSSDVMTSPMQANKKDITLQDEVFSPNQLIEVPGEIDFGPYLEEDPFEKLQSDMFEIPQPLEELEIQMPDEEPEVLPTAISGEKDPNYGVEDIEMPIEREVMEATGIEKDKSKKRDALQDWEIVQETPLGPQPLQGRRAAKRRKLTIDRDIQLSGDFIRANLANPSSTLKQVIIGGVRRMTVNELFALPASTYLANDRMKEIWKENAKTYKDAHLHENFHLLDDESRLESPDRVLRSGITPSSIEIPRAVEDMSTEFERSVGSSLGMDSASRLQEARRASKRRTSEPDLAAIDQRLTSQPRSSQIGFNLLSPIADEFGEEFDVPLEDIDEVGVFQESSEDDLPSPKQEGFLRDLVEAFADREEILFSEIAVPGKMKRKIAARAFFYTLAVSRRQIIDVNQDNAFGEIRVTRGTKF